MASGTKLSSLSTIVFVFPEAVVCVIVNGFWIRDVLFLISDPDV